MDNLRPERLLTAASRLPAAPGSPVWSQHPTRKKPSIVPTTKKCLLTGASFSRPITGLTLGAAPTAIASRDVNGVHDGLLPTMCRDGSNRSSQSFWYHNVSTKQLLDRSSGLVGKTPVWQYLGGGRGRLIGLGSELAGDQGPLLLPVFGVPPSGVCAMCMTTEPKPPHT